MSDAAPTFTVCELLQVLLRHFGHQGGSDPLKLLLLIQGHLLLKLHIPLATHSLAAAHMRGVGGPAAARKWLLAVTVERVLPALAVVGSRSVAGCGSLVGT